MLHGEGQEPGGAVPRCGRCGAPDPLGLEGEGDLPPGQPRGPQAQDRELEFQRLVLEQQDRWVRLEREQQNLYRMITDSLQRGTKRQPKADPPTKFDGQNTAPREFLEHLEDYFKVLQISAEEHKRNILKQYVTGSAWYLLRELHGQPYEAMKVALTQAFATEGAKMARRQQLQKSQLALGGDLEQYISKVLSDAHFIELSEKETVTALKFGLQGKLKMCVELDKAGPTVVETCLSIRSMFTMLMNNHGKDIIGQVNTELQGVTNSLNHVETGLDTQHRQQFVTGKNKKSHRDRDHCHFCRQRGHWKNECPERRSMMTSWEPTQPSSQQWKARWPPDKGNGQRRRRTPRPKRGNWHNPRPDGGPHWTNQEEWTHDPPEPPGALTHDIYQHTQPLAYPGVEMGVAHLNCQGPR